MNLYNRFRVLWIFIQLIRNPNRTDLIFRGVDIFSKAQDRSPVQFIEDLVLSHESFKQMYNERYFASPPDLERLKKCADGTFGRALFHHMNKNNLDFSIWPEPKSANPIEYLSSRIYQDHDLWHTLLGYGVDVEDELAVQGFGVAQFRSPVGTMIIAGGLLHLLKKGPQRAVTALWQIATTISLGRKAKFLLGVRLHDYFDWPIDKVRELCGLQPKPI